MNGVILISWRQKVLEKQIDYGAKLGQVVLSLAKMELNNFYKNVMPVAEYFDQSSLLVTVSGGGRRRSGAVSVSDVNRSQVRENGFPHTLCIIARVVF